MAMLPLSQISHCLSLLPQVVNMPDQYLLHWSNHLTNIAAAFSSLRQNNKLVDVTLAADGRSIQAHKVVLCACSAYFEVCNHHMWTGHGSCGGQCPESWLVS